MSELLELNIRAKKATIAVALKPPQQPGQSLVLEDGKKYITYGGKVIEVEAKPDGIYAFHSVVGWHDVDGRYSGGYPKNHSKSIRMEWFSTWKEYDAWMAGKKMEWAYLELEQKFFKDASWHAVMNTPVSIENNQFCPGGTLPWWHKHLDGLLQVRVAPTEQQP